MRNVAVAVVQHAPVYLNLAASLERACTLIAQAAAAGAQLVAFGESWLSGYPAWLDYCEGGTRWNDEAVKRAHARHRDSAVEVPGPACERLAQQARAAGVVLVMGVTERVRRGPGNGTLYNTLLIFDASGQLLLHHRKLVPTHGERLLWGPGDGVGLRAVDTAVGRVGGLICWEHWMPLARHVLHCAGEEIHIALWPAVTEMHAIACRHYAFEARCHVLAVGGILRSADMPEMLNCSFPPEHAELVLRGGSAVVAPDGRYLVAPKLDEETLIFAELDMSLRDREVMALDVSGHYHRPDIFSLQVRRERPEQP